MSQQPAPASDARSYQHELFTTLLKWSSGICAGVTVTLSLAYLRTPVWSLLILCVSFALFSAFSWWCVGRLRRSRMGRVVQEYLAIGISLMALVVLFTQ